MVNYCSYSDEELLGRIQEDESGITDYLLEKYKNLVRKKAKAMYLIGGDNEDLIQEGMIGLFKAVRDYNLNQDASFHSFADLCISRQIYTAIKLSKRQKHMPLNSYVSLNKPVYEEESERTLSDVITQGKAGNPEDLFIDQEDFLDIESTMQRILSPLEQDVVNLYLEGKSYVEIAQQLDRHVKSVDNALQRVKRKLEQYLESRSLHVK